MIQLKRYKQINNELLILAILITSFFYCLPLGRFSIGFFDSDFRIFDFTIFLFLIYSLSTGLYHRIWYVMKAKNFFAIHLRWLIGLLIFSFLFFILYSKKLEYILPAIIRAYRFIAYMLMGASVIAIVSTKKKFNFILTVIMINIWIQAILGFLQGLGILSTLWPDYWNKMYFNMNAPVATLSPHHKHIGVVMLVGFGMTLGLVKYYRSNLLKASVLILLALVQLSVPLFAGTRTFLLGSIALFIAYIYINRGYSAVILFLTFIFSLAVLSFPGDAISTKINNKYEERISSRVDKLGYEGLYGERTVIYVQVGNALLQNPYLIVTGTGFQNISSFIPANGAHNNFLNVLMELGIFGLILFLKFLLTVHRNLLSTFKLIPSRFIKVISSHIWIAFVGIVATMFVGETIWGQAAMFTLAGQIMAILGLGVSPLFWAFHKSINNPYAQHTDFI